MSESGQRNLSLYGGCDPRELPAYTLDLAARFLLLPKSTLKAWVFGATWKEQGERLRTFEPLIDPPNREEHVLSFVNLVEAHVLKAVRRRHLVHMIKVRSAIENLKQRYGTPHPLADIDLLAGGRDLFLEEHGTLLNLSLGEQVSMDFLAAYLSRIERDFGRPNTPFLAPAIKLFPFVVKPIKIGTKIIEQDSKIIAIDPYVSFGRPIIDGTGIPTEEIAERFWAGDSISDLIEDFGRTQEQIEYALRYETEQLKQAA